MMILQEAIGDLKPARKAGVTLYPASALASIFDWAAKRGRTLEWVEGVFYRPDTDEGQLSVAYIRRRGTTDTTAFRQTCLRLGEQLEAEAASLEMHGYFEIGVSE